MSEHPPLETLLREIPAPEVLEHLEGCADCQASIRARSAPLDDTLPERRTAGEEAIPALAPDRQIDRYVVEGLVGRGGISRVYRVRHASLGGLHALKVLHRTSRAERDRLFREGRAQGGLRHPNVIPVTDMVDVDGSPGLIMEYVDGPSLADLLLKQGPPSLPVADRIAVGILRGVAAVHRAGFVHRDLKPSNVLLALGDDGFIPKVADLGLVRPSSHGIDGDTRLTQAGSFLGTPAYMAPEQIRDASEADVRSDVFSLGAVLHELVSGRRAFDGGDVLTIYDQVRSRDRAPLERLAPHLPARVLRTIERALEPDPADRFPDCRSMLDAWIEGADEMLPSESYGRSGEPPGPAGRRRLLPATVAVAGGAALVLGLASQIGRSESRVDVAAPPALDEHLRVMAFGADHYTIDVALDEHTDRILYADAAGLWAQEREESAPTRLLAGSFWSVDALAEGEVLAAGLVDGSRGLWRIDAAGRAHLVLRTDALLARAAPDGTILFADRGGLWLTSLDGARRQRLRPLSETDYTTALAWAPSGRAVAAVHGNVESGHAWLEITRLDGATRRVLQTNALLQSNSSALAWVLPDRLLFTLSESRSPLRVALHLVDDALNAPPEAFRDAPAVHRWSGHAVDRIDSARDGGPLLYRKTIHQYQLWRLALEDPEERTFLKSSGWQQYPQAWYDEAHLVVLLDRDEPDESDRDDVSGHLYLAPLDGSPPTRLADGPVYTRAGLEVVEGAVLFWRGRTDEEGRFRPALIRLEDGEETVLHASDETFTGYSYEPHLRCGATREAGCVLSVPEGEQLVFRVLDPVTGAAGPVRYRHQLNPNAVWELSDDGRTLAVIDGRVQALFVHDLRTGRTEIHPIDLSSPQDAAWDPSGGGLLVTAYTATDRPDAMFSLVRLDLEGRTEPLWTTMGTWLFGPTPSPDGRSLVVGAMELQDEVWLGISDPAQNRTRAPSRTERGD